MAGAIRICSHNIDGFGSCDIMADGVCVQGPCHAEELAEYAPVIHGEWRHSRYVDCSESFELVKCSNCSHEAYAMAIYVRDGNYCPNCGAKMDGGDPDGR